jgi:outer membrane protein assembly factor BamB
MNTLFRLGFALRRRRGFGLPLVFLAMLLTAGLPGWSQDWPQWGRTPQHTGAVNVSGQRVKKMLDDLIYDPLVAAEKADPLFGDGDLHVHYQVPLTDGDDVYMEFKTGTFTSPLTWNTQTWNEKKLHRTHGHLSEVWSFESDWKPVPFSSSVTGPYVEPVFHAVLAGNYVYVPGFGGSIYKVAKSDGHLVARIQPFGPTLDPDTYEVGPLAADAAGNVYYNALKLDHDSPWDVNPPASYLVKVSPDNTVRAATVASLTPGVLGAGDPCRGIFSRADLPWPPSPDAVPASVTCGAQRVSANSAPAIAPDGTIYIVTVAHFWFFEGYLVAVNPDLTPKWTASLANRLTDGCNVILPPNGTPGGCRAGAHTGIDPWQNRPGGGFVSDNSTSVPVVLPDGSILYGAFTIYPYLQGHLMKFSASGQFLASYPFGWDDTPAVYPHDDTYSIITKDNHYNGFGAYCSFAASPSSCPRDRNASQPASPEAYFITRLDSNLQPEWRFQSTNTQSCSRDAQGHASCVSDHPAGFEWCVNAPAVDRKGNVFVNSEDGNLYAIRSDGRLRDHLFLDTALGAAYTPLSIAGDGRILTQNNGHLFVVGDDDDD